MLTKQQKENYLYFYRKYLKAKNDESMDNTTKLIDMNVYNGIDMAYRLCLSKEDYNEICNYALNVMNSIRRMQMIDKEINLLFSEMEEMCWECDSGKECKYKTICKETEYNTSPMSWNDGEIEAAKLAIQIWEQRKCEQEA